jgi:hypothetical protein
MKNNKVITFYLLMLVSYVAHVFEEIWGQFWILNKGSSKLKLSRY